jgi:AcrR family transcriptional regulator
LPQRLKEEVRTRIVAAAAAVFAAEGYAAAKLSDVAARAETSTSNIYKYFENKEALFAEIVTPTLAAQLLKLLRARVRELGTIDNWPKADAEGSGRARALLSFWVEHRLVVLILLRGADGTPYAHVRQLMLKEMERQATRYLIKQYGREALPPALQFVLGKLFLRSLDMIADILEKYESPSAIQQAFGLFWRYQLAGLQSLLVLEIPHKAPANEPIP